MAHIVKDRVKETTTTTGTGSLSLAGAASGFVAFSSVCANNDTVQYAIVEQSGSAWEVGLGTWQTGNTLARTTVYASSNAGSAVNFGAGTKDVFLTMAAFAQDLDVQEFTSTGSSTWTKPPWALWVRIELVGGGGGGGSGCRQATSANRQGGGGGSAGGTTIVTMRASVLSATETVVVGAGGTGGASAGTDTSNGSVGLDGNVSTFTIGGTTRLQGPAGQGGAAAVGGSTAGTTRSGGGNWNGTNWRPSNGESVPGGQSGSQGVGSFAPTTGTTYFFTSTGGGGGGGQTASTTTAGPGGIGGGIATSALQSFAALLSGASAGASGSAIDLGFMKIGLGGGGGSYATAVAGTAGGNGAAPGGGGGGGSASDNGFASGKGGDGANGWARITSWR